MTMFLPPGYESRARNDYFDDSVSLQESIVFQPEIYPVAELLMTASKRTRLIDIGCGIGSKLVSGKADARIGIDFGSNIARCREQWPGMAHWIEADLEHPLDQNLLSAIGTSDIVICSDVVQHLIDPEPLLGALSQCFRQGALVITSTPDRVLVRGNNDLGPPANRAHVREWATDEYGALLKSRGLPPLYLGLTLNNDRDCQLRTTVSVHEPRLQLGRPSANRRPLAIISCYNEADVISEVIIDLIAQGCDVHVIDNWSTDETWLLLQQAVEMHGPHVNLERFPDEPDTRSSWHAILRRKEEVAARYEGRWIIHTDADEIRRGPIPGLTLSDALAAVEAAQWNRVQFTVLNYRPTDHSPFIPGTLRTHFSHFEFGTKPGHFVQKKAWIQGKDRVDLANSGGHIADFADAADCPYHFILHHYPLRSLEHGKRKIMQERLHRWSEAEQARGWHSHYVGMTDDTQFIWDIAALNSAGPNFWREHGLPIMSGLIRGRH